MTLPSASIDLPKMPAFTPSEVCRLDMFAQPLTYGNPFGFSVSQLFREDVLMRKVREFASASGVDARAEIVVETLVRWKVCEKPHQQHITLDHHHLVQDRTEKTRDALGSGLLYLVACQIVARNEAHATYREMFTDQSVAASYGHVVPQENDTASTAPADAMRSELVARFGKAGDHFYKSYHASYPVTVEMTATPQPVQESVLSDDDDDGSNEMPVDEPVRALPMLPSSKMLSWYTTVLRTGQFRVGLVFRGYVCRETVKCAARLEYGDNFLYVLDGKNVAKTANQALVLTSPDSPYESVSSGSSNNDDDDNSVELVPHLLDRLDDITLSQLCLYEVETALRHRINLHMTLYAHVAISQDFDKRLVARYPSGYDAPILQRFKKAPGLLSSASHADYAAIALAALCVMAKMSEPFHQWLLRVEAYYHLTKICDADATPFVSRLEMFISNCVVPPRGEYFTLLESVLKEATAKIFLIDKRKGVADEEEASEESDSDESEVDETQTE